MNQDDKQRQENKGQIEESRGESVSRTTWGRKRRGGGQFKQRECIERERSEAEGGKEDRDAKKRLKGEKE